MNWPTVTTLATPEPEIVPIILPSDRPPQGVGEVVLAPLAPAIAQAVLHATGRRLDVMPFPEDAFKVAAASTNAQGK